MDAQVKSTRVPKKATSEMRAKFVRLAQSRTVNAIRAIRVIGKLGNKSHYEYDEKDVKKIVGALIKEIDALKARMSDQGGKAEVCRRRSNIDPPCRLNFDPGLGAGFA